MNSPLDYNARNTKGNSSFSRDMLPDGDSVYIMKNAGNDLCKRKIIY